MSDNPEDKPVLKQEGDTPAVPPVSEQQASVFGRMVANTLNDVLSGKAKNIGDIFKIANGHVDKGLEELKNQQALDSNSEVKELPKSDDNKRD